DVQRYREMVDLARDNYDLHLNIFKQIEERQISGIGRGVDLEQAHRRQALAQSNLITEAGNLNDVEQRYQRIIGHSAPAPLVDNLDGDSYIPQQPEDRKSTRLNSSHVSISYAVFCLKKKTTRAHQPWTPST